MTRYAMIALDFLFFLAVVASGYAVIRMLIWMGVCCKG